MNTALQLRENSIDELQTIGQVFVKSGFFAETRDAAQAIVKIMAGAELGFPKIASMTGVYIVKGKVSLSANLMAAAIKRSGKYNYRIRQLDDKGCKIEFFEDGQSVGFSDFTRADAQNAGLAGSDTYKKFFRNMSFARAMSNGAKWYCPDIFGGPIYTPEELGATVDGETGEVIEMPVESVEVEVEPVEPEPVRNVKLECVQPQPKQSATVSAGTRQILGLIAGLKWDGAKVREWMETEFSYAIETDDLGGFFDSLQNGEQQKIAAALKGEFSKQ